MLKTAIEEYIYINELKQDEKLFLDHSAISAKARMDHNAIDYTVISLNHAQMPWVLTECRAKRPKGLEDPECLCRSTEMFDHGRQAESK